MPLTLTADQRAAVLAFIAALPDREILAIAYGYQNADRSAPPSAEVRELIADYCDDVAASNAKVDSDQARRNVASYTADAEKIRVALPKYALVRRSPSDVITFGPVGKFTYGRALEISERRNIEDGWVITDGMIDQRQRPNAERWDFVACEEGEVYQFATDEELDALGSDGALVSAIAERAQAVA